MSTAKLHTPSKSQMYHKERHDGTDYNTTGKPDMEVVEFGCFYCSGKVSAINGLHAAFHRTVGDTKNEGSNVETPEIPGKKTVSRMEITCPQKANIEILLSPTKSHSGPPNIIARVKPQNAVPVTHPTCSLVRENSSVQKTHGPATQGETHGGHNQRQTTGEEKFRRSVFHMVLEYSDK